MHRKLTEFEIKSLSDRAVFRRARMSMGLSLAETAEAFGLSRVMIHNYEGGIRRITEESALKMARLIEERISGDDPLFMLICAIKAAQGSGGRNGRAEACD